MKIAHGAPKNENGLVHLISMEKSIHHKWVKLKTWLYGGEMPPKGASREANCADAGPTAPFVSLHFLLRP